MENQYLLTVLMSIEIVLNSLKKVLYDKTIVLDISSV